MLAFSGYSVRHNRQSTYIFADNLLKCKGQNLPWKYLDVFFDVSRLRVRESHNDLEELFPLGFGLRDCLWFESLQVPSNPVLLFHRKSYCDQRLQQENGIHTSNVAFLHLLPPNAANANTIRGPLVLSNSLEGCRDCAS